VTEEGRELVSQARRRRDAWLAKRLKELSPEERAILRAAAPVLEKLSQA
jgi:DNA-binding MarR family transcriptional regulator